MRDMRLTLETTQEFLSGIIDAINEPVFVKDRQHRWVLLNDACCKFIGHPRENLIGKSDYEFFPKAEADVFWEKDEEVFESGRSNVNEESFTDHGGAHHTIVTIKSLLKISAGQKFIVGIIRDVTEKKKTEVALKRTYEELESRVRSRTWELERLNQKLKTEMHERGRIEDALKTSEERYALATEGSNIGVWEWNLKTDEVYFSPTWKKMLGHTDEEIPNSVDEWRDRLHPEDYDRTVVALNDYLEGRVAVFDQTYRLRHKDGSWRRILTRGIVFVDEKYEARRLAGTNIDITDQKRIEDNLHALTEELERSNRDLTSESGLGERQKDYLHRMQQAGRRMQSLIEDVLIFSKIATTEGSGKETVDLNTLVADILEDLEEKIRGCKAVVIVDRLPVLRANPTQMRQLFQNLLSNALKYCKENEPPHIQITSHFGEGAAEIRVTDNGIGFDSEHVQKIFKPFQRLHAAGRYEGNGIGLAICQRITERHGGRIAAEGVSGKGATFIVTLPIGQN
jgi:PAS domain S-box-containing protein